MTPPSRPGEGLLWYTRARRIPRLVGKLPGSERGLPFGPYTITQIVGGGLTFVVLTNTTKVWGKFGFFGNLAVQAGVTLGVTLALRLVKSGGRDPLTAALALLALWVRPRFGPRRSPRPISVRACCRVLTPDRGPLVDAADNTAGASVDHTPSDAGHRDVATPVHLAPRPVTNLDRLRART